MIVAGADCPYKDECDMKYYACNGQGCPFAYNKVSKHDFSCVLARFYEFM